MGYMNGTQPTEDDASFDKWDSENSTVISWLLRSMQPEISNGCIFLETTKDIWETVSFKFLLVYLVLFVSFVYMLMLEVNWNLKL